ncbi:MAG TPA: DegV family protein [Bellilinea sp.]|nr:DegV family protein [Bellilinea sp.]
MSPIRVVVDSCIDLPKNLIADLPLTVVPLQLTWEGERLLDGVDITMDEFYKRIATSKVTPTTSQPSPEQFRQVFQKHLEEGDEVLCITVSSKLSGTYNSAIQAKNDVDSDKVSV